MSCILRISGRNFDVDGFLKATELTTVSIYRKGERNRFTESGVQEKSGCNIEIGSADLDEFERQKEEAIKFLTDQFEKVKLVREYQGESAEINFGIRSKFMQEDVFSHTDFLPAELLFLAGKLGIGIALSHYWAEAENLPEKED